MEKGNQEKDEDVINAELFGNDIKKVTDFGLAGRVLNINATNKLPLRPGHVYSREDAWKLEFEELYNKAKTFEDIPKIASKINEAMDNNYNIDFTDYQAKCVKKMTHIIVNWGGKDK